MCGQKNAIETCGCLAYDEIITPNLKREFDFCGNMQMDDLNEMFRRINCSAEHYDLSKGVDCECLPECEATVIRTTSSQTSWPEYSVRTFVYNQ